MNTYGWSFVIVSLVRRLSVVTEILIENYSVSLILFNKDIGYSIVGPLLHFGNSTASCVLELLLLGCVVLDVILKLLLNYPI